MHSIPPLSPPQRKQFVESQYYIRLALVYKVWSRISEPGHAADPIRLLASDLGMTFSTVRNALVFLRGAGYIQSTKYTARTRVIILPFRTMRNV